MAKYSNFTSLPYPSKALHFKAPSIRCERGLHYEIKPDKSQVCKPWNLLKIASDLRE